MKSIMSSWFRSSFSNPKEEDESSSNTSPTRRRADEWGSFTASKCPSGPGLENSCEMPLGLIWTPMAASNNDAATKKAVIDCGDNPLPPVVCLCCLTFINPFVEIDKRTGEWICPMCGHENMVAKKYLRESSWISTALKSTCVEYRQSVSAAASEDEESEIQQINLGREAIDEEDYCTYLFVVDENLSPKDGQAIAPAVEAVFREQASSSTKARIGLISFGESVSMYQLGIAGVASSDIFIPEDDDTDDAEERFGEQVEKRAYLTQVGEDFTSFKQSLSSIFGVAIDDDEESSSVSRMAMLSQKKAARLRKQENGDATANVFAKSPWVKQSEQSSETRNGKRATAEAFTCALEIGLAAIPKPSRTSRIIFFTNGCPNTGEGNVVGGVDESKSGSQKRVTHDIIDTDVLRTVVEAFEESSKDAVGKGVGCDVFCCGSTELALPVYQAMVEPSGGYVLTSVSLDTAEFEKNLNYIVNSTYMSRSLESVAGDDDDGPDCIIDVRTDRFVTVTQMCGSCEMIEDKDFFYSERIAFEEGSRLAKEKGMNVKNLPSSEALNMSLTRIKMGRVDPLSTASFIMEVEEADTDDADYAFFQLIARYTSPGGDEDITRVSSFRLPVAEDVNDFVNSIDDETMSVVLSKVAVYRALHGREETDDTRDATAVENVDIQEKLAHDTQVDIDATVQRISGAFRLLDLENKSSRRTRTQNKSQSSLDFAFPSHLKEMLNRIYHLRRGPLISPGPMSSLDDRAENRGIFLRLPIDDCLEMIRPSLWSTGSMTLSSGWESKIPFPPETLALWDDSIVAADFHDSLFIWSGGSCKASRYNGIRDKFQADLMRISKNRFPAPKIYYLEDGDSMSRRFTARLAPSHADPVDNQLVHFPALTSLKPDALNALRSKFKFYDSKSDASFRSWFWSVASASNKSKFDGLSLSE